MFTIKCFKDLMQVWNENELSKRFNSKTDMHKEVLSQVKNFQVIGKECEFEIPVNHENDKATAKLFMTCKSHGDVNMYDEGWHDSSLSQKIEKALVESKEALYSFSSFEIYKDAISFLNGDSSKDYVQEDKLFQDIKIAKELVDTIESEIRTYKALETEQFDVELNDVVLLRAIERAVARVNNGKLQNMCIDDSTGNIFIKIDGRCLLNSMEPYSGEDSEVLKTTQGTKDELKGMFVEQRSRWGTSYHVEDFTEFLAMNKSYTTDRRINNLASHICKSTLSPLDFLNGFDAKKLHKDEYCQKMYNLFYKRFLEMVEDSGMTKEEFFRKAVEGIERFYTRPLEPEKIRASYIIFKSLYKQSTWNFYVSDSYPKNKRETLNSLSEKYDANPVWISNPCTFGFGLTFNEPRVEDLESAYNTIAEVLDDEHSPSLDSILSKDFEFKYKLPYARNTGFKFGKNEPDENSYIDIVRILTEEANKETEEETDI